MDIAQTPVLAQPIAPKQTLKNTTDIIIFAKREDGSNATIVASPIADSETSQISRFDLALSENFKGSEDLAAVSKVFAQLREDGSVSDFSKPTKIIVNLKEGKALELGTSISEALKTLESNPKAIQEAPRLSEKEISSLIESTKQKVQNIVANEIDSANKLRDLSRKNGVQLAA